MENNFDDDFVFPHSDIPRRSFERPAYYPQDSSIASPTWWRLMWSFLDFCTSPNVGVFVAITVIAVLHFKPNIQDFLYAASADGWQQTMVDLFLSLRDLIKAYYQMALELLRGFKSISTATQSSTPDVLRSVGSRGGSIPRLVLPSESSPDGSSPDHDKAQLNNSAACARSPSPSSSSSSSLLHAPLLQENLEPAFLNDTDYPKGWLVYHPSLGVVTKEEADNYKPSQSVG